MSYSIVPVADVGAAQHRAALVDSQGGLAEVGREAEVAAVELPMRRVEGRIDESGVGTACAGGREAKGSEE